MPILMALVMTLMLLRWRMLRPIWWWWCRLRGQSSRFVDQVGSGQADSALHWRSCSRDWKEVS
jgi:hypothetical protein